MGDDFLMGNLLRNSLALTLIDRIRNYIKKEAVSAVHALRASGSNLYSWEDIFQEIVLTILGKIELLGDKQEKPLQFWRSLVKKRIKQLVKQEKHKKFTEREFKRSVKPSLKQSFFEK